MEIGKAKFAFIIALGLCFHAC